MTRSTRRANRQTMRHEGNGRQESVTVAANATFVPEASLTSQYAAPPPTWEDIQHLRMKEQELPLHRTQVRNQKRIAAQADEETERNWYYNIRGVMNEVDWDVFDRTGVAALPMETPSEFSFLDLGCCPGGFSSYVLMKNPKAIGIGVSLEDGHNYLLEDEDPELADRHTLFWLDLVRLQLAPTPPYSANGPQTLNLTETPHILITPETFDLIILDGHPLPVQKPGDPACIDAVPLLGPRLLVSQLFIALSSAREGATLFIKLVGTPRDDVQRIICMLDALCDELILSKPTLMFATQESFYVVARGIRNAGRVGLGSGIALTRQAMLHGLQQLWTELTFGRAGGNGMNSEARWNFICTREQFRNLYQQRYTQLTAPVLKVLRETLEAKIEVDRKGGL